MPKLKYIVQPSDTIYVDKFHLSKEYLLAFSDLVESDWVHEVSSGYNGYRNTTTNKWIYANDYKELASLGQIVVLSSEFSVGDVFDRNIVVLNNTIHDEVYGDINIYRNIRLPYLSNVKSFLFFVSEKMTEFKFGKDIFGISMVNEILHTYLVDPNNLIPEHVVFKKDMTGSKIIEAHYSYIDGRIFDSYMKNLFENEKYSFIFEDGRERCNELLSFIKYSIFESFVFEYFNSSVRKQGNIFYTAGVDRVLEELGQHDMTAYNKCFKELVPESGPLQASVL